MIVRSLKLRNFRNYENAYVEFEPGMNILTGHNAQGKTNLLESMIYLSLTRSHRIANEKKLIREDMPFAAIDCTFSDGNEDKSIRAVIHPNGKSLFVNQVPLKKSSEFIGLLNVVLFAPDDLYLFSELPRERRRIMNQEITKISPSYLLSLNQYQNLLKERNIYLKSEKISPLYLDTLDEKMAEAEVHILKARRRFIESVNQNITPLYRQLSDDDINVSVAYKSCMDQEITKDNLLAMHRESRKKDIDYHMTSVGVHREDMIFNINDKNLIMVASQGQKRMVMLGFKMALLKYIEQETGKKPVFLLDDVLSELDEQRQKRLLEMIGEPYQCFITATQIPSLIKQIRFSEYRIDQGTITKVRGGKV